MLAVLVFLACLDELCRHVEIVVPGTVEHCWQFGHLEVERWVREHPGLEAPHGFRCLPGSEI